MNSLLMKNLVLFSSLAFLSLGLSPAVSASIKLNLIDGKKFTDYEISNQSRARSLKTLERDLKKLFGKVSSEFLDEKHIMEIDITNIDLPGIYYYSVGSQHQDIRIVDSNTPYKLYFSYRLKDSEGKIVKQGKHKIKEFSDSGIASRHRNHQGTVGYYQTPLTKWFKMTFVQ